MPLWSDRCKRKYGEMYIRRIWNLIEIPLVGRTSGNVLDRCHRDTRWICSHEIAHRTLGTSDASTIYNFELRLFCIKPSIFKCNLLNEIYCISIQIALKRVPCDLSEKSLGVVSIRETVLPGMAIPMLKIRRPNGRLIFNMEIAIRR